MTRMSRDTGVLGPTPVRSALVGLMLLAALQGPAQADIYRFQDKDGNWHFSDRPPPGAADRPAEPKVWAGSGTGEDPGRDLAARLDAHYHPATPVERSSLAVVKIEVPIGVASGFFVSADGLILTNRHVVRPPEGWYKEKLEALAKAKASLDSAAKVLAAPRSRYSNPDEYDKVSSWYKRNAPEYRRAQLDLEILRNRSTIAAAFPIQLKDGTKLTAELIAISSKADLALLQLKDYRTPFIEPLVGRPLSQTQTVYLIGSPLGVADTISRGVFTGRFEGMLATDSKILPGNSGGPMVTESGKAVGINTIKITSADDSPLDQGIGLAIPIETAFAEFPQIGHWATTSGPTAPQSGIR